MRIKIFNITIFCIVFVTSLYSQSTIDSEDIDKYDNTQGKKYPNTNIYKTVFYYYLGFGYVPFSRNFSKYFESKINITASFNIFTSNNMAFSFSFDMKEGKLKHDLSNIWQKDNSIVFNSYGLSVGYSLLNLVRWQITPFCGLALSISKPNTDLKKQPELKLFKTIALSPEIGLFTSYRFIRSKRYNCECSPGFYAINIRTNYVPFAIYKKSDILYHGGILYLTIGACFGI